jgi:hypothetical protein
LGWNPQSKLWLSGATIAYANPVITAMILSNAQVMKDAAT